MLNKTCYYYSYSLADKVKWWHTLLAVIAPIFCVPGMVLWIVVGVVVSEPPDDGNTNTENTQ